jgi:hypothetical protein
MFGKIGGTGLVVILGLLHQIALIQIVVYKKEIVIMDVPAGNVMRLKSVLQVKLRITVV